MFFCENTYFLFSFCYHPACLKKEIIDDLWSCHKKNMNLKRKTIICHKGNHAEIIMIFPDILSSKRFFGFFPLLFDGFCAYLNKKPI
jgi:hypothetical protein